MLRSRLDGVTLISAVLIIVGIYDLFIGFTYFASYSQSALWVPLGSCVVGFGLTSPIIGFGLLKAKRWAWTIALISASIGIINGSLTMAFEWVVGVFSAAPFSVPGLMLAVIMVLYLPRESAKDYFGKASIREELF